MSGGKKAMSFEASWTSGAPGSFVGSFSSGTFAISLCLLSAACGSGAGGIMDTSSQKTVGDGSRLKWPSLPVSVFIEEKFSAGDRSALMSAMSTWEAALGKPLFNIVGEEEGRAEGANGIYQTTDASVFEDSESTYAHAVVSVFKSDRDKIARAKIEFNAADFAWEDTMALSGEKSPADTESVALHELGHFLGFSHEAADGDEGSTMKDSQPGAKGYARRRLSLGDIERLHERYGCDEWACDAAYVEGRQTGVQSTTYEEAAAWLHKKECNRLLAKYGRKPGDSYSQKTEKDGASVEYIFECGDVLGGGPAT